MSICDIYAIFRVRGTFGIKVNFVSCENLYAKHLKMIIWGALFSCHRFSFSTLPSPVLPFTVLNPNSFLLKRTKQNVAFHSTSVTSIRISLCFSSSVFFCVSVKRKTRIALHRSILKSPSICSLHLTIGWSQSNPIRRHFTSRTELTSTDSVGKRDGSQ